MKVTELLNRYKLKTRQAIDEIGIVELINQKLGVDNREKNYYWTSNKSFNFELVRDGLASIIFI